MSAETLLSTGKVFLLPDLGEGLTEAELVTWLVAEGDTVAVDQPVAEVETAKSTVEVPSPYAGVVVRLHGEAGSIINVGAPLISVEPAGAVSEAGAQAEIYREEERAGLQVPTSGAGTAEPAAADTPNDGSGSGNVLIGYGTPGEGPGAVRRTRRRRTSTTDAVPPAAPARRADTSAPGASAVLCISPLVRKLARDGGVDLRTIQGSGANGMILREDVEKALHRAAHEPANGPVGAAVQLGEDEHDRRSGLRISARTPVRGVRRTVAEAMARSRREIPEATVWVDVDATALVELRAGLKRQQPESTPGLLALVARFALAGLARYPELNTRIVERQDGTAEILSFEGVNLGVAAQTGRGLMVPCIRRADTMSARQLDAEVRRLTQLARDGKAAPADLTSGTFTLNNYGVFGVDGSAAIINHPEAAILGMGRIIDRPWVVDGALAVRKVMELTLTFDHRVCDGGVAGGFLRYVADAVENPGAALVDL